MPPIGKSPTQAEPAQSRPGWLWPGVGRAPCNTNKTIDFRTSILYVVDEEYWLKWGCMVVRRMGNPLASAGTVCAERGAKAQLK